MAYDYTFEVDFTGGKRIEGEFDISNPNDGIRFTDFTQQTEVHIKAMQNIMSALERCKHIAKDVEIEKFTFQKL